ncbi:hypothetical protein PXO_06124 [Xanthomonas oryzae pv. oryzae PXO99A]|uniref:Uncharacterized protein n=1 Tax=Xanthomonas oryzae pv. oryzae (strain PXO99A) TaxID=360094 RepID=A0A0J9WXD0_XANOP|nr:hypothetical protein PXO_01042 [Xanthomonas oryzae pv. oryzae PXO99A]ACD59314.1 hypothetical protein PXO_06124 [Xanthomonas oryzae pv. oryzae PXO99A]
MSLVLAPLAANAGCRQATHAVNCYLITILRSAFEALQLREVVAWKENVSASASGGRTLRCGTWPRRRR